MTKSIRDPKSLLKTRLAQRENENPDTETKTKAAVLIINKLNLATSKAHFNFHFHSARPDLATRKSVVIKTLIYKSGVVTLSLGGPQLLKTNIVGFEEDCVRSQFGASLNQNPPPPTHDPSSLRDLRQVSEWARFGRLRYFNCFSR